MLAYPLVEFVPEVTEESASLCPEAKPSREINRSAVSSLIAPLTSSRHNMKQTPRAVEARISTMSTYYTSGR